MTEWNTLHVPERNLLYIGKTSITGFGSTPEGQCFTNFCWHMLHAWTLHRLRMDGHVLPFHIMCTALDLFMNSRYPPHTYVIVD